MEPRKRSRALSPTCLPRPALFAGGRLFSYTNNDRTLKDPS